MKTAAYTICKNEKQFVEKWLFYTQKFNYRVILDTGSTDGTYELFQEAAKTDSNLILEQKTFTPWKFDVARKYNLSMVPNDVEWALSPDLDEYFSINVLDEMIKMIRQYPDVTNISCDRLDVYSEVVRVGPPHSLGTNKIHRRHDYTWAQPIYEHLSWIHKDRSEVEIYNENIYLIHDQDFKKKTRRDLYIKMLTEECETNPTNDWTLWFLVNHYFREQDMENFIKTGCDYVKCSREPSKKHAVEGTLRRMAMAENVPTELRHKIIEEIG
jgi:glycosyltransferase involved in cell wall biosynthesis